MVDEQKPWNIWDAIDANADIAYQEQQARYAERERLLAERSAPPKPEQQDDTNAGG